MAVNYFKDVSVIISQYVYVMCHGMAKPHYNLSVSFPFIILILIKLQYMIIYYYVCEVLYFLFIFSRF